MSTSVHIPEPLLAAVDRKAQALKISRNRLIINALERELAQTSDWSPDFFDQLASPEPGVDKATEAMLRAIQGNRLSRKPVRL